MADEDVTRIEALVEQVKSSNDVDTKVDALSKLETELQRGIQIHDAESFLDAIKPTLRTSNQHLTFAAVSLVPPLLPLLVTHPAPVTQMPSPTVSTSTSSTNASLSMDILVLRHALNALLPSGGLIERLGDREKIQQKARESLIILGGLVFRCGGSSKTSKAGTETPLMIFERYLREAGFLNKVWKVREQSILVLADIRKQHHLFPLRSYLPFLVTSLEDTDAHVRDCAKKSVVEIFSGPGVTDHARADLKKEMTKKGVRKTIVDSMLSQLLGGSTSSSPPSRDGSENGDAKPSYVPPSLALQNRKNQGPVAVRAVSGSRPIVAASRLPSRPQSRADGELPLTPTTETSEILPVYIASSKDLEDEFASMSAGFEGRESEHNWADRERSIVRVRGLLKGDIHIRYKDAFLRCLKDNFIQWSMKGLASLRTTLSSHACSLYNEMGIALGHDLDPFCEVLFRHLLKMTSLTKKIIAQHSQATVTTIITCTSPQPRILVPLLWHYIQEKNVNCRTYAIQHVKTLLDLHGEQLMHMHESHNGMETLEKIVKKALDDPNPSVRECARICFWVFHKLWPDRGAVLIAALNNTARKQLQKVCPDIAAVASVSPPSEASTAPGAKKSSVAAAIAASRAKAKAIATSPPSLRHQATSGNHVPGAAVRRPSSPGVSRATTSRPSSPLRVSSVSPSATAPVSGSRTSPSVSGATSRAVSMTSPSKTTPNSPPRARVEPHSPTSSNGRGRPESPTRQTTTRRRLSSPLAVAPNTSPSKRASVIRQSLGGVGVHGNTMEQAPPSPPDSRTSPTPRSPISSTGRRISHIPTPIHHPGGDSFLVGLNGSDEDSLLLAQEIPVPEDDSDSDGENLLSFSAPFEIAKAEAASRHNTPARRKAGSRGIISPRSPSQGRSISPKSITSRNRPLSPMILHSHDNAGDQSLVIEDALRATAEQAESAAERLLEELVDPEDTSNHSMIPPTLIPGSTNGTIPSTPNKPRGKSGFPIAVSNSEVPSTPVNRNAAVMHQAALFKNSPAYDGRSSSLLDMVNSRHQDSAWWLKRKSLLSRSPQHSVGAGLVEKVAELQKYILALDEETATVKTLQQLTWLCLDNPTGLPSPRSGSPNYAYPLSPSPSSSSAPSLVSDMWEQDRNLDKLLNALFKFLHPSKSEDLLEYGLMLLWQLLESQATHIEGHEAEIFSLLLNIRYCNKAIVLEATNQIRDLLATSIECVYGLTTMHASLKAFQMESVPSLIPSSEAMASKTQSTAFGLLALGKFIVRFPPEILEEELPRIRPTLINCLNETSVQGGLVVREAAAAAIIAAQLVLKDEGNLFVLLDGLRDDKKNLLTYLFDKHGVRGNGGAPRDEGDAGMEKLEREMRRLDTRTTTPSRVIT